MKKNFKAYRNLDVNSVWFSITNEKGTNFRYNFSKNQKDFLIKDSKYNTISDIPEELDCDGYLCFSLTSFPKKEDFIFPVKINRENIFNTIKLFGWI